MLIKHLILTDFVKFRVNRVSQITITIDSNTQLIIGSNGSGKSSLLHELFPYAPVKSSFGKDNAYKELVLSHGNNEYKIIYSEHGHIFLRDGINLNKNGNHDTQRELIEKYLGLNNNIHTILKCSLPICDMTPSLRKKSLIDLNPMDIYLFLEKYKHVHKNVVAYGNNLDRLYMRKKQLIDQKLPDEQYKTLLENKATLENQEKLLLIWSANVDSELRKYRLIEDESIDIGKIHSELKLYANQLSIFADVRRSTYQEQLIKLPTKITMINEEIVGDIDHAIEDLVTTLNEYEAERAKLVDMPVGVNDELSTIYKKLEMYKFEDSFVGIPENMIDAMYNTAEIINNKLVDLTYITYGKIVDKTKLNETYRILADQKATLTQLNNELTSLDKQYAALEKTVKTYNVPDGCDKSKCELLRIYDKHTATKITERDIIVASQHKVSDDISKLQIEYTELSSWYETQLHVWSIVDSVLKIVNDTNVLRQKFDDTFIIDRIRTTPLIFNNDIISYISDSVAFLEYQKLHDRIIELKKLAEMFESKQELSASVLDTEIRKYNDSLAKMRNKHASKLNVMLELESKYKHLRDFDKLKIELSNLSITLTKQLVNETNSANRIYLTRLFKILHNILTSVRSELLEVIRITNDQNVLIERLDKEVNLIIDELKPKYDNAKLIEKTLSQLPIDYTRSFVNNLIITTNYFLGEIMTYPLSLVMLDDDDILDFGFPVMVDDVLVKDISSCSDGQRAMINLSFNLALIIELKYNNMAIYIDEADRTLDNTHTTRLAVLLSSLVDKGVVSQLFVVGHHPCFLDSLSGDVIVLNSDNITLPAIYNEQVEIIRD